MKQQETSPTKRMKHISFVLPDEERRAFRHLCFGMETTPSEALRAMVRIALGQDYNDHLMRESKR